MAGAAPRVRVRPLSDLACVSTRDDARDVLIHLQQLGFRRALVACADGSIVGVVSAADLSRLLRTGRDGTLGELLYLLEADHSVKELCCTSRRNSKHAQDDHEQLSARRG
jgi:CBS domain-containing protein